MSSSRSLGSASESIELAVDREHLVGVAHGLEAQHAVDRPDGDQRLLRAQHEAADRDLVLVLHHLGEQAVGLGRVLVGHQVVRLLEVHGVDLGEVDEVLDLDLPARLGLERGELVGLDHHVVAVLELVALDDLVVRAPLRRSAPTPGGTGCGRRSRPRAGGSGRPATRVADTRRTGTVTSPKLIDPVQMAVGKVVSPILVAYYLRRSWRRFRPRSAHRRTPSTATTVEVDGRRLRLTNLDKVLYPATGFTKGQVVDYYARIAPAMLPHLEDRPVTMLRLPDGIAGERFFEKRCPGHRPAWLDTVPLDADSDIAACSLDSVPALVWTANLAALELHTPQARAADPWQPSAIVFDLDPGPGADLRRLRAGRARAARPPRPARPARGREDVGLEGPAPVGRDPPVGRRRDHQGVRARAGQGARVA